MDRLIVDQHPVDGGDGMLKTANRMIIDDQIFLKAPGTN